MKKNKKNLKGMTLIELLITVSIIAIMSTVFLLDFNSGREQRNVDMAAREVSAAFREAQNYALTGNQGVVGTNPCGFEVNWSGSVYTINYRYRDAAGICNQAAIFRSYNLKNGIVFNNSNSFTFSLPHAGVSNARGATLVKGTYFRSVCINVDGLISDVVGVTCP